MTGSERKAMSFRDLTPIKEYEIEVPDGCDVILKRVQALVASRSFLFANYWRHKGHFVGRVTDDHFVIRRFIRDFYVPLVIGRVKPRDQGCCLHLRFVWIDGLIVLAMVGMLLMLYSRAPMLAVVFTVFLIGAHIRGCLTYKKEIARFLRAVNV